MKTYETKGTFIKKGESHKFSTIITAENEKMAKENLLSRMGSKQNLIRTKIHIESITEAK